MYTNSYIIKQSAGFFFESSRLEDVVYKGEWNEHSNKN